MARKTRRLPAPLPAPAASRRIPWAVCLAVALLSAGLGAGGAWLALRPALSRAAVTRSLAAKAALALGDASFNQQDWPQAIAYYTQALADGLDNPDLRTDLGSAYRFAGQPQKALEEYTAAQAQNPRHENSLFNQGGAYVAIGDASHAIAAWRAYLTRFPHGAHVADARLLIAEVRAHGAPGLLPPGRSVP